MNLGSSPEKSSWLLSIPVHYEGEPVFCAKHRNHSYGSQAEVLNVWQLLDLVSGVQTSPHTTKLHFAKWYGNMFINLSSKNHQLCLIIKYHRQKIVYNSQPSYMASFH